MGSAAPVARLALTTVGYYFGGPIGGAIGSIAGNMLFPDPAQKVQGPRLSDLKVTGVEYGQPIPYLKGMMRVPGQVWWASDRREIATTTSTEQGGKGGGQEVEQTTYTYEVDILFGLTSNEIAGVTRIWLNGKLVWTNLDSTFAGNLATSVSGGGLLATAIAYALASLTASQNTTAWQRLTVYTGDQDQMPDPTYEAAVGTENAVAYRGRGSVFIQGLQLGSSGIIPNLTFEVVTKADAGTVDETVYLQADFDDDTGNDISSYQQTLTTIQGSPVYDGGYFVAQNTVPDVNDQISWTLAGLGDHANEAVTIEFRFRWNSSGNSNDILLLSVLLNSGGGDHQIGIFGPGSGRDGELWYFDGVTGRDNTGVILTQGVFHHVALVITDGATPTYRLYMDGKLANTATGQPLFSPGATFWKLDFGLNITGNPTAWADFDFVRVKLGEVYTGTSTTSQNFTPPELLPDPDSASSILSPLPEDLADVVAALCSRAGLSPSQYDISGLQGSPQVTVRGMAITQVTNTRSVLEMLMQAYFFEAHCSDKIYFVFRGGASVETIDFEDMGASEGDQSAETFQLAQANDIEAPAQKSITYANYLDDYQADTQESDREVSAVERSVEAIQLPLALTPSEAKTLADKWVLDQYVSMVSSTVRLLGEYANVEPTDIITPTDADGNGYRMRVIEILDDFPKLELKVVMDSTGVLTHTATTSTDYEPSIVVEEPPTSEFELLDIPILRDADDEPGFYAAMKGSNAENWPGGVLFKGLDQPMSAPSQEASFTESAVFGTTTTALGDWSSGRIFDMVNTVTVSVGEGTLSSSTRAAVLADQSVNAMLIGEEVIQFITATLVSAGVYTLSGLLRGSRGTGHATTGHAAGERCALLRMAGLRRIAMQSSELGSARYYAGVTFGRTLTSSLTGSPAGGESFTNTGRGLAPFSPAYLRFNRETNGDITITGQRRSRLAVRMTGSLGINVPDDDTASWLLDILSNEGSPQTTYRTLTGSVIGNEITWTYTTAQQTTDFGSPTPTQLSVGGYGFSSTVGRGEGKFKTGAV